VALKPIIGVLVRRFRLDQAAWMFLLPTEVQEVHHALAVGDEPVGDIGAVALQRVAFGAHDAGAALDAGQGAGGGLELLGLHVVGV